jgi:hypothetical protein
LTFDDDAFESRLVWMFGSTRTGSTWLLRMLCHPLTLERRGGLGFRLPETARGGHALDVIPVNEFLLGHHLAPRTGEPILRDDGQYEPRTVNSFWSSHSSYALSEDFEEAWKSGLRRFALARLHAVLERAAELLPVGDDPAILIKDVGASHAADLVMSLLSRSRLLFMVRDGRDVLDSLIHAAQSGGWFARITEPLISSDEDRLEFVRQRAIEWACWTDSCRRAWAAHPPELRRMVRYEELLAEPVGTVDSVRRWIGIGHDHTEIEAAVSANAFGVFQTTGPTEVVRAARPGLWRENLSSQEQRVAEEIMGDRLSDLGYPVDAQ